MKNLAKKFLSESDKQKISAAVQAAEKHTSGEIVPMVVSASYQYPMSDVLGATALALPSAIVLTYLSGQWLWLGAHNMWLFLGIFTALFIVFHRVVKQTPSLKRWFISSREIEDEVQEAAVVHFFEEGLYRTRDETGVLIFVSVFEQKVWVLADRGIDAKVPEDCWKGMVRIIVQGIREGRPADAICEAVTRIGEILREHFPVQPDDADELRNIITKD